MKSERRHELQHNDLAEWAVKIYNAVVPYRSAIIGVAILLVVATIGWSIWRGHSEGQAAESWNALGLPGTQVPPNVLQKAAVDYKGTKAGEWAQILTGDLALLMGQNQGFDHKDVTTQDCTIALDNYEKTLVAPPDAMGRERAMFGKARSLESLGKLEDAFRAYQELNKEFPQGTYKAIADQRLVQLNKPETVEFYKTLAQYNPKPKKESPRGKVESLAPLPENPEEPALTPPVKPGESTSGTASSPAKSSAAAKPTVAAPRSTGAADSSKTPAKKDK